MNKTSAIAHRGFSAAAPENTLAAFRKAIELKPDFMECDVHRTKDGHLVVIHDPTVDRTTNGKGAVADMTLAEIRELDAGSWFSPEYAGERIPTLEEALDLARGKVKLIVEIKDEGDEDQVVAAVQSYGMSEEVLLTSFHYRVGMRLPGLDERIEFIPLIYVEGKAVGDECVRLAGAAANVNGSIFGVNFRAITPELAEATHASNMRQMAWTVDNEDDMRSLADMGVDIIASNKVDLLIATLESN